MTSVKPVLLFGYGNASRGDDALGPMLLDFVETKVDLDTIELIGDVQLQIEHALDLENRHLVLFVDASVSANNAFEFMQLTPLRDTSYTTHAMSPAAVLDVYQAINHQPPPPSFLLSIKAEHMDLGESLSRNAQTHLECACQFAVKLLRHPTLMFWQTQLLTDHA